MRLPRISSLNAGRGSGGLFIVVALVTGLLAALLVYQAVNRYAPSVSVVLATREIQPGEEIKMEDLIVRQLPALGVTRDSIRDTAQVAGKHARGLILRSEVLRPGKIAELADEGGALTARTGGGNRAMALPLELLGGVVPSPGDKVDIVAVINPPVKSDVPSVATTVVRGVPVLDVFAPDGGDRKGHFVVGVSPKETELLSLALAHGKVYAVLQGLNSPSFKDEKMTSSSLLELFGAGEVKK